MDLKPPRGTLDLLPPEGGRMRALYDRAAGIARRYGYRYVETPGFEHTELFQRTSGESSDIVTKEMYTFVDRGKREVTLRPEATASIVRAFLDRQQGLPSPFKVFTTGSMWRYGRPQSGRLREFRQFNVEAIGEAGPAADVEVIAVGDRFLSEVLAPLSAEVQLQINSIGDQVCRPGYRQELVAFLSENEGQLTDEHARGWPSNPLRVLDCKDPSCQAVAAAAPKPIDFLCEPCREHFDRVRRGLTEEGVQAELVPTLVRGLDYYTRTAFEWVSADLSAGQSSVGGGGRYDGLAEVLGGPPTPGVGFAIGLDRVLLIQGRRWDPPSDPVRDDPIDAFVVAVGEANRPRAAEVVRAMRQADLSVSISFEPRPLGTQLKMATRAWARFAVIVGEKEAAAGTVTWRRLSDGVQSEGGIEEAISHMKGDRP